ncbi:deoxycytidylate deaminase [Hypericibacter terrae]|uniref:Deoxycytidylate deaminase n=1 Tax=Hypericibacter terrae TaxID=2602015 RepID=A0A5J6MSV3_9PROT|nr:anti-phage dCTP deaminase [Hypericibacter terrae]QEX19775.1 deoxycytidylate deaminase [Hypericibacter terrae]
MAEISETSEFLTPLKGQELVFGLVGPIGADLKLVAEVLSQELANVRYVAKRIKITDCFESFEHDFRLVRRPLEAYYKSYIDAGNELRKITQRQDILALMSIAAIRRARSEITGDRKVPASRTAYILHQFKRPEEISALRRVYGPCFVQISAHCPRRLRELSLTDKISESYSHERRGDYYQAKAVELIVRDDAEEEITCGQRVRETFPLADVVINASSPETVRQTCRRFIEAFFGNSFITPTLDEYGVYLARSAALRSADLSRQVGVVIANEGGDVVAASCNEVPKAFGGAYWPEDTFDLRDFKLGYDPSTKVKRQILSDVFRRLKDGGWLSDGHCNKDVSALVEESLDGKSGLMHDSSIMDILEFGRVVHAEMHALSTAARNGIPVKGATLFTTTFPCHICARHIVAAGIKRVVYVEPYAKSLAGELYPDSIEIEGDSRVAGPKVSFEQFKGIGSQRFYSIFQKRQRKDRRGNVIAWSAPSAEAIPELLVAAYVNIESAVLKSLSEHLAQVNLKLRTPDLAA